MRVAKKTEIAHASIWGAGRIQNEHYFGGIYLASTVSDSCEIHNCTIEKPEVIGTHGSIEHLRKRVFEKCGNRFRPKMGELYWITDRTPHESLPLKAGTQRTFFRLVTSSVSHWYKGEKVEKEFQASDKSRRPLHAQSSGGNSADCDDH